MLKMWIMSKVIEEAKKYKDLPTKKLKKTIRQYKSLSRSNSDMYNFVFSFIIMILTAPFFMEITYLNLCLLILVHYLFFWEFLHKYKKSKLLAKNWIPVDIMNKSDKKIYWNQELINKENWWSQSFSNNH